MSYRMKKGDIVLERLEELPSGAKEAQRGDVELEAPTGKAGRAWKPVGTAAAAIYRDDDGRLYLEVPSGRDVGIT